MKNIFKKQTHETGKFKTQVRFSSRIWTDARFQISKFIMNFEDNELQFFIESFLSRVLIESFYREFRACILSDKSDLVLSFLQTNPWNLGHVWNKNLTRYPCQANSVIQNYLDHAWKSKYLQNFSVNKLYWMHPRAIWIQPNCWVNSIFRLIFQKLILKNVSNQVEINWKSFLL